MSQPKPKNPEYLETRSVGRLLLEFSLPAIAASSVTATYNLVARIFVGQRFGTDGIAAVTTAFPMIVIFLAVAMTIGTGATILISIRLGERRNDKAEEVLGQALFLSVATAAIFIAFGLTFIEPTLRLFGASERILPLAKEYLSVLIWGVLLQHIAFGVNNFIRAEGRPKIAMASMIISAVANAFFDWYFLIHLKTGIWGAGLANVLACGIAAGWICWLYFSDRTILKWRLKYFRFNWPLAKKIALFGTVPFATQACSAVLQATQNNLLGFYGRKYGEAAGLPFDGGDVALGVMGTIVAITMMIVMPFLGLGQGLQPIVGYNVGAKRPERVLRALTLALQATVALGVVFWSVGLIWPEWLVRPFLKANEVGFQETWKLGTFALRAVVLSLPLVGVTILAGGYFQAQGRPILALMLTLTRQLLFLLPCMFLLPLIFERFGGAGLNGCWFAFPISDTLAFGVAATFLYFEYRAKRVEIREMEERKKLGAEASPPTALSGDAPTAD